MNRIGKSLVAAAVVATLAGGAGIASAHMHGDGPRGDARGAHGMMGGHDMMGGGMMGGGMMGGHANVDKQLSADDVRAIITGRIAMHGNKRLKVGAVQEKDADTVTAEVVTVDDSLVQRLAVNRHTGAMQPAE